MSSWKKLGLIQILVLALMLQIPSSANSTTDEMFKISPEPGLGYLGYTAFPVGNEVDASPGLVGMQTQEGQKVKSVSFCKSINDIRCEQADYFQYISSLGICTDIKELNCIADIFAEDSNGKKLDVEITNTRFNFKNEFLGDLKIGLPPGVSPPVIEIPGAPHAFGISYLPVVTNYGSWDKTLENKVRIENSNLSFYAVKLNSGNFDTSEISDNAANYYQRHWRSTMSAGAPCIINDSKLCAVATAIPSGLRLGLEIRVDDGIQGWFHGRIEDPVLSFQDDSNGYRTLRVLARSTKVPAISIWKKKSEITENLKNFYAKAPKPLGGSGTGAGNLALQNGPEDKWSLMRQNNTGFGAFEMEEFINWLPNVNDRANYQPTVWNLKLMTNFNNSGNYQNCQTNSSGVVGIVSTNATQYLSGPPVFNEQTEELEYKVAAPHLTPDGSIFRGSYDLLLKSSVAKCLYGITGSAFKVSISVISAGGELIDASTTVTERDGWFYFSARGFTFSAPTIRVKLVADAQAETKSSDVKPNESVSTKPVKKNSVITCVKGKSTKKITGSNPKCPKGFRKR